jgi:hypothetical protein
MNQRLAAELSELRSSVLERVERLEDELVKEKLGRGFRELHTAIQLCVKRGREAAAALEVGLRASVAALPRGKAGGLARARSAWRSFDGTFMPESEKEVTYREEYERYAAGGRARAVLARRDSYGKFLSVRE